MKNKDLILNIFLTMAKIGLFTFGGGYAMIALLEEELVNKRKWIDKEEFLDLVAIAESTPGPIAINAATYIGHKMAGILGAVCATVAICLPSFTIIYIISLFLDSLITLPIVSGAFRGIQVCVVYLVFSAGMRMLKKMKKTKLSVFILCSVVALMLIFTLFAIKFSTVYYILACGVIGVCVFYIKGENWEVGK